MKLCIMLTILASLMTISQSSEASASSPPPQIGDGQNELLVTIKDVVLTTLGLVGLDGHGGGILGSTGTGTVSRSLKELQDDSVAISGHEKLEEIEAIDAAAFRAYVVKKLVELVQAKKEASDSPKINNGINITALAEKETSASATK